MSFLIPRWREERLPDDENGVMLKELMPGQCSSQPGSLRIVCLNRGVLDLEAESPKRSFCDNLMNTAIPWLLPQAC